MGFVWDWSKIVGVSVLVLGLAARGYLSPPTAAAIMVLYVMIRGAVRGSGCVTKPLWWTIELSFLAILCIAVAAGHGGLIRIIPIVIDALSGALSLLAKMLLEGDIRLAHAIVFVVLIIVIENLGARLGNPSLSNTSRRTFFVGIAIASVIIFIGTYGSEGEAASLTASLLTLLLVLGAVYLMTYKVFR